MSAGSSDGSETTHIALVRHGQSAGNAERRIGGHGPTPLTPHGHRQAEVMAAALVRSFRPTALVTSDLVRARQTATAVAEASGLELVTDPRWRERSLGVLDDLLFDQIEARHPELWQRLRARDPSVVPPQGESLDQVYDRVSAALDDLVQRHRGGRVAVVSHGLAIFHAVAHIFGLGSPGQGLQVFTIVDNCSISTFHHKRGNWYVHALNDRAHLPEP
ncbi:histidine phosphatase family protein [Haliangium sp.]|uniref:histidine phosphatase family protein n=1 Tax=Haliangium sp. TaxID=2663208 RepID=UPI003D101C4C